MKALLFCFFISSFFLCNSQIPKSGTYIYSYCDIEYNKCTTKCKVVIKGNKIWIYAPAGLTGIKEGALFDSGTLVKDKLNKWVVQSPINKKESKNLNQPVSWVDFKRKKYWTF